MTATFIENLDWCISDEEIITKKRYVCDFPGCLKSYSSRQNRHRHRVNEHGDSSSSSLQATGTGDISARANDKVATILAPLIVENASTNIHDSNSLNEQLVSFREVLANDINHRQTLASNSNMILEKKLKEFMKFLPNDQHQRHAMTSVIDMVHNATPDTIVYLKQFAQLLISMTNHLSEFSDVINPKSQQSRALKLHLDKVLHGSTVPPEIPIQNLLVHSESVLHDSLLGHGMRSTTISCVSSVTVSSNDESPRKRTKSDVELSVLTIGREDDT